MVPWKRRRKTPPTVLARSEAMKQSIERQQGLDCFASLATTDERRLLAAEPHG